MQAQDILSSVLSSALVSVHRGRLNALCAAVEAVIRGGTLVPSDMGRAINPAGADKHGIKRVDRLLANAQLAREQKKVFAALCAVVLQGQQRPVLLVDWMDVNGLAVLAASVPTSGRAITVYVEAHPRRSENNPRVEAAFLDSLRAVLPPGCCPTLVTDAGFRVPWLQRVRSMGWDFVARVRGRPWVQRRHGPWRRLKEVYALAPIGPEDLGPCLLTRYKRFECRMVSYADALYRKRRKKPLPRRGRACRRHVRSGREPWVLVTSRQDITADRVAAIYALRMRIEETFRDQKNARLGWALAHFRTDKPERLSVMLLVGALAHWLVLAVGYQAERQGLHRAYQANTVRDRRVISLARLGTRVLQHVPSPLRIPSNAPALPLSAYGTLKAA